MVGSPEAETSCSEHKKNPLWKGHTALLPILGLFKQHLENSYIVIYIPCRPVRRAFCILSIPSQQEEGGYIGDKRFKVPFKNIYHCHPVDTDQRPASQGRQAVLAPDTACSGKGSKTWFGCPSR